jgi:hypothetical protein
LKKILFLTTHNLATNPRLVKEIRLAIGKLFQVEIICFEFKNWSYKFNQVLIEELQATGVKIHCIPAGRTPFLKWILSVFTEVISEYFLYIFPGSLLLLSNAISRRNSLLLVELKKIDNADIVIGHNPGAIYPTYSAGKRFKCKTGFDVEDYHPGEGTNKKQQRLVRKLMTVMLPRFSYVSFASPLIEKAVLQDVNSDVTNWFTVFNYFSAADFIEPPKIFGPVKMVWFSQNIDGGRGLELILKFVKKSCADVELHLFGNLNKQFCIEQAAELSNVTIHAPVSQTELHKSMADFDIGLATDIAVDINRELAVTNKLLVYLQAGLYVLATNTKAHSFILDSFPLHGKIFDYTSVDLEQAIAYVLVNKEKLRGLRMERFKQIRKQNWEDESNKLYLVWN